MSLSISLNWTSCNPPVVAVGSHCTGEVDLTLQQELILRDKPLL